ncbi:MAG: tetratricopeptide repeat protein [Cellvibrionaceae bacterium]
MLSIKKYYAVFALLLLLSACGSAPTQQSGNINPKARPVDIPDAASAQYQQVLVAVEQKDWATAESLLLQMQSSYPRILSLKASLGWVYWQANKTEQAVTKLESLIDGKALYKSDAYNYLAIIYREQGSFKESETLYKQALQIWPGDAVLHKNLGILYELYLGRLPEALASYKQAQAINRGDKRLNGWVKDLERRTKK